MEIIKGALFPSSGASDAVIIGIPRDDIVEYRFMQPVFDAAYLKPYISFIMGMISVIQLPTAHISKQYEIITQTPSALSIIRQDIS
jgi:hypothetical protein